MPETDKQIKAREAAYWEAQKKTADNLVPCTESLPALFAYAKDTPDPLAASGCPDWAPKKKSGGGGCQIL